MGPAVSNLFQSSEWSQSDLNQIKQSQRPLKNIQYFGSITKGKNYIWCGAIVLAWRQLKQKILFQDVVLQTYDINVNKLVDSLNKHPFSKKDISRKSVYAKAGIGADTLKSINKQCANKFSNFKQINKNVGQNDLVIYAHLFKKLEFPEIFQKSQGKTFPFNGRNIYESFYAKTAQHKKQIFYLDYQNEDNFLFGIYSKKQKDLIYFAKNTQKLSQNQVFDRIEKGQPHRKPIDQEDQFGMPNVKINHKRHYKQFQGIYFDNLNLQGQRITYMEQELDFQINQRGATVQFNFSFGAGCCIPQNKKFYLDKSFWVVMKQKGKLPYFCAYIQEPIDI